MKTIKQPTNKAIQPVSDPREKLLRRATAKRIDEMQKRIVRLQVSLNLTKKVLSGAPEFDMPIEKTIAMTMVRAERVKTVAFQMLERCFTPSQQKAHKAKVLAMSRTARRRMTRSRVGDVLL